jgi:YidC/Oxa1 family membrane protein insertase
MGNEKRLILAVVLMLGVVALVNVLFPPQRPPEPTQQPDSVEATPADLTPPTAGQEETVPGALPIPADTQGIPEVVPPTAVAPSQQPQVEDTVWVSSPIYRFGFTSRGGRLVSAEMLEFESLAEETKGQPVQLVPPGTEDFFTHQWLVGDDTLDLRRVQFDIQPRSGLSLASDGQPQTLTLTYTYPGTEFRVELSYTFTPDNYVIDLQGRLVGGPGRGWWLLGLGPGLLSNEWDPENDYRTNLAYSAMGLEGVVSEKIEGLEPGERLTLDGPFDWVAVRTKYFLTAVVLPFDADEDGRFGGLMIRSLPEPYRAQAASSFPVSREGDFQRTIYMGPQDYGRLKAVGRELDKVLPFGYKWLEPVLRPLAGAITTLLTWMHSFFGLGYGWILIIFGIGIRVVLFPLYQKSMRSQMATMRVQPLMKEIQEKHKNDPQKLQQEMMKLYREHKVNPLGGCLPMLLPFPILIALFFVFRDTIEFRGVPFLWLPDLSQPDPLYIIPVLMGASIFLLQWITMKSSPPNPQMKMMMYVMPVMMVVLFFRFASGLNLYYATMNLASLPQQLYVAKERKAAQAQGPPGKKPEEKPRKKSKT